MASRLFHCEFPSRCAWTRISGTFTLLAGGWLSAQVTPADPVHELAPLAVQGHPAGTDETTSSLTVLSPGGERFSRLELRDALLTVPGVHLDQPGGAGGRTTLYLRGAEENHALIFLDGVPLNDPTNSRGGAVDLSLPGPGAVKQLAVVRGPASVRYGPEAVSGVVHLQTTGSADTAREFFGAMGGQDFHRAQLDWTTKPDDNLTAGLLAVDEADGQIADGGDHRRRFLRGFASWSGAVNVSASSWYASLDARSFPDDSGGLRHAAIRDLETREQEALGGNIRLSRLIGEDLRLSLQVDAAEFDTSIDSPGVAPGPRDPMGLPATTERTEFQRTRTQILLEGQSPRIEYSGGIGFQRETGESAGSLDYGPVVYPTSFRLDRDRLGIFGEISTQLPAGMHVTLGARGDRFTDEPWRATLRAGLRGSLGRRTEWRITAGNAFKPASFYALANPLVGNPELSPETSESIEAGLVHRWNQSGDFVAVTVFSTRTEDGIDFDPGPPPILLNRHEIRSQGIEWRAGFRPVENWLFVVALTYLDASAEPSGDALRGRPDWRGGLRAEWTPPEPFRFGLSLQSVGTVSDTSIPTGDVDLGSWTRLDATIRWDLSPDLHLLLALDNVLDREYEEAVGFIARSRRARVGLRAGF